MRYTATYSPDDNKLRLYAATRLDAETYARVKAAGFKWAPKQDLFVAPMWTPEREDLLTELAGEIDDEDTSLTDRAEERAERFEGYQERRAEDAERARAAVSAIADNIPLGQPILVGHHSERHARRDAEKIENGMRRAVKMWKTSQYWQDRAAGAIRHAKYKERPDVRARRIKTIEADARKMDRADKETAATLHAFALIDQPEKWKPRADGTMPNRDERAAFIVGRHPGAGRVKVARKSEDGGYFDYWSAYDVLRLPVEDRYKDAPTMTIDEVVAAVSRACDAGKERRARWREHYENRLTYERAMLAESGYQPPPKPVTSAVLPLLNYSGEVAYRNPYQRGEIIRTTAHAITKAEFAKINSDYKGTRVSECGTHRVRTALVGGIRGGLSAIFLTDSKEHPRPGVEAVTAKADEEHTAQELRLDEKARRLAAALPARLAAADVRAAAAEKAVEAIAQSLRAGVKTVTAPQLFPTPVPLAARVAALAEIPTGARILEPSAGTGRLIDSAALTAWEWSGPVVAVEHSPSLASGLHAKYRPEHVKVHMADFLTTTAADLAGPFDRVIMNPPFENAADVKHIQHALTMLAPGGRLVAVCANGPRQREALAHLGTWEDLPAGTFKAAGTGVNTALLIVDAPAAVRATTTEEAQTTLAF